MTLEDYIAQLNSLAFWREFTFAQNRFSPVPGRELELADNLVWFGDQAFVLQLKQRDGATTDPAAERVWFEKKILKKATSQIRDTLHYLEENVRIHIRNEHGHGFDIERAQLKSVTKIVVYLPAPALPDDCRKIGYHVSRSTGDFIHIVAANDYLGILEKLRVPEDINRYFAYREAVLPRLRAGAGVEEADIMGGFLYEEEMPSPQSRRNLRGLIQDLDAFDLSGLLADLHKHIEHSDRPHDYYAILREFARVPRSVWREVKLRFTKSLEIIEKKQIARPFRLSFPESDCAFMIAPLDPELPATGIEGAAVRTTGLTNLTMGAKYLARTSKAVGILVSRDGEYVQIDWCFLDQAWEHEPEIEARLADANPFRAVAEKMIDGFYFESQADN